MSTAEACERLFDLMRLEPEVRPPAPIDPYEALAAQEEALRGLTYHPNVTVEDSP